jgi:hypothetical protein
MNKHVIWKRMLKTHSTDSLYGNTHDPEKERPAPPLPTSISFPDTASISKPKPVDWTPSFHPNLFLQYAQVRRPTDITSAHLEALNTRFEQIKAIEDITSEASFVPTSSWLAPAQSENFVQPGSQQPQSRVLSNGRPFPTQVDFYTRSKELQHENKDAFRALSRRGAAPLPRLAHFRKFWEGLDNMGYYWDTTSDEYIPPKVDDSEDISSDPAVTSADDSSSSSSDSEEITPDNNELEPRKRPKRNPDGERIAPEESILADEEIVPDVPHRPVPNATSSSSTATARTKPPEVPGRGNPFRPEGPRVPEGTYRGKRIGSGSGMPDMHRFDTIRSFVEPIAWAFGFTIAGHRKPTALSIGKLLIPIKLSSVIWRPPNVREKARAGWLEGPVMGISCRAETEFAEGKSDAVIDTLREIGAMLLLAQERSREGQTEVKPGENQWWTTKPRWGGGKGGDAESPPPATAATAPGDSIEVAAEPLLGVLSAKEILDGRGRGRGRAPIGMARKKLNAVEAWQVLRQGVGLWDPRVEYKKIGGPEDGEYDEVCLP